MPLDSTLDVSHPAPPKLYIYLMNDPDDPGRLALRPAYACGTAALQGRRQAIPSEGVLEWVKLFLGIRQARDPALAVFRLYSRCFSTSSGSRLCAAAGC